MLTITTELTITDGEVDDAAALLSFQASLASAKDNYKNQYGRVADAVNKVWGSSFKDPTTGKTFELDHQNLKALTRSACALLEIYPNDDNLETLKPTVDQVMKADNRFARISNGRYAGYHFLDRIKDGDKKKMILDAAKKDVEKTNAV